MPKAKLHNLLINCYNILSVFFLTHCNYNKLISGQVISLIFASRGPLFGPVLNFIKNFVFIAIPIEDIIVGIISFDSQYETQEAFVNHIQEKE